MRKRIVILLVLCALGAAGWYVWRQQNANNGNRISLSGNLELTQVDISFKTAGRLVERTVNEGDWVKKGQLIARLDPLQLQQQTLRDKASIQGAESN
jgi:HlyD family secretion protein